MTNTTLRDTLIILAIILLILALIPPLWTKVILLAFFSFLLTFCIIKYRRSTSLIAGLFYFAGVIISVFATAKMFVLVANEVVWVQIATAIVSGITSFAFLIWILAKIGQ